MGSVDGAAGQGRKMKEEIIVVLDRSGSMSGIRSEMIAGLRGFVDAQKKHGEAGFTLARFDNAYEMVHEGVPISSIRIDDSILEPRHMTALFDAVGKTIVSQGERFSKMREDQRPQRVALLVITDGLENASCEWSGESVSKLIAQQRDQWKWAVTFLGCDIDAFKGGASVGVPMGLSLGTTRNAQDISGAFNVMAVNFSSYRASGLQCEYTASDRSAADPDWESKLTGGTGLGATGVGGAGRGILHAPQVKP